MVSRVQLSASVTVTVEGIWGLGATTTNRAFTGENWGNRGLEREDMETHGEVSWRGWIERMGDEGDERTGVGRMRGQENGRGGEMRGDDRAGEL